MRHTTIFSLTISLCLALACAAEPNEKLGDIDEPCFSDEDCRAELVCERNFCFPAELASGAPCGGMCDVAACVEDVCTGCGDGQCEAGEEEACPQDCAAGPSCQDLCLRSNDCQSDDFEDCSFGCQEATASWTQEQRETFFACMIDLDCDDLSSPSELSACLERAGLGPEDLDDATSGSGGTAPPMD
jgi:hypothetical protein